MKRIFTTIISLGTLAMSYGAGTMLYTRTLQTPDGLPKASLSVTINVAIHAGAPDGTVVFGEQHSTTTSPAGVAYIEIGNQSQDLSLDQLDWAGTTYYLETSVDMADGSGFQDAVCVPILSVPRAMSAMTATNLILTSPGGNRFSVAIADDGTLTATPL